MTLKASSMASSLSRLDSNPDNEAIADTADRARQLFLCCREIPNESHRKAASVQLARFNLWASNIGVFAALHASLDFRLRTDPVVRATIEGNLEILCRHLLCALNATAELSEADLDDFCDIARSQTYIFGLKLLRESSSNDEMRLRELVFVEGTISTLHQLSLAIRKASNRNSLTRVPRLFDLDSKYTIIRERGENAGDSEALVSAVRFGTSSAFEEFVRRVLVSRWLCPSHEGVSALDSKPDAYRQALLDRCVATVSTRRRQLEYFRGHQMRLAQQDSVKFRPTPQQHIKLKSDQQSTEHLLAVASKAPGPNLTISHEISNIDPSETVGSEFQSNAFRLPPPSSVASSTTSSSAAGGFRSGGPFEVPPPPKLGAEEKEKACPYCCLVLPAKTFLTERKAKRWEKHLLEDLQPYICLFKNCSMGGKSYSSFKAWQAHLSQPHPPSWLCPLHAEDADHVDQGSLLFDTLSSFENHLTTYHPDVDPLDTDLADRASQPAVIPQECFVCFEELLSLPILHRHMANHFKSMLLLALPWRDDIEEEKMMLSDRLMSSARPSDARRSLETDLSSIDIFESADTDAMLPGTGGQNYGPPPPEGGQQLKPKDFESLLSLVNANPITGEDRVRNSETWATAQMPNLSPDVDTPPPNLFPGLLGPQIVSDPEHVEIDIWFVHGLTGDSTSTWTHPESNVFWPKDLLAMDFPQARIITFGYDINIIRFAKDWGRGSDDSLRTYGRDLAYAIRNILQQLQAHPSRPRPIYFIAHSLGGLVVEQALLESLGPDESLSIIARLAAGILFFGVPHQAFHLVKWGSALTELIPQSIRDTNKKVLDALEKDSNVCRNVDRDFQRETNHGRLKKIMIFSFYETEKLPGFANLVVPRESAVLTAESSCPINGDHMSITRFSGRDDPDYAKVKGQLTHWLSLSTVRLIGKDTVFINETDFEDFEEYDDDANIDEEGLSIGKSSKGKEKPPTATHSEDEEASDTGLESADSKTDGTTVPDSAQTAETSPKSYGLKVLFSPAEPALAIADIVFVHGLMGSSDTWLHKESNIHWPQDLLPQDISDARILQFSYDADILRLWNSDFPSEIDIAAEDMLKYLARIREGTSFEDKKIFFVAHSVGGLVTQAALNISRSSPQEYIKKVGEYIQGIAFLGTPQCGGDFVQWADIGTRMMNMVQNSNMDIVAGLKPRSGVLGVIALLQHDFLVFLRRRREEKSIIHITCFYEELPLETPDVGLVVPKDSAILAAYSCYGMLANHLDMTKFESSDDPSYQDICGELLRWMKPLRANQVVQDPGRDNSFPKGKKMKYPRKFEDGDRVWLKVATNKAPNSPDIVVYIKEAQYEERKDYWMYRVQEQDKKGLWCGKERMIAEKVLKRA